MFLKIDRRPVDGTAMHAGYAFANSGSSRKVAPGVAPWSRARPNRTNETVVILPALLPLSPSCFQLWPHAVLRVQNLSVYT